MTQQKPTDPSVTFPGQIAVAAVLWAATFVATKSQALSHPGSFPMRVALTIVGIGGFLPIVYVYAKSIRRLDEFNQRIHLIALATAFALVAAVSYTCDLLHQARFIPELPATGLWALMVMVWFVCMILTQRFYR